MNELRQALVSRYIKDVLLPNSMDGYTGPAQIADDTINVIESARVFPGAFINLTPLAFAIITNQQEFRDMVALEFEWLVN